MYSARMRPCSALVALLLAGAPGAEPKAPQALRASNAVRSVTNGVLTGLDFTWDLGPRRVREVRLGRTAMKDGSTDASRSRTTLRASFRRLGRERTAVKVEVREIGPQSSGTSAWTTQVVVFGGLGAVRTVDAAPSLTAAPTATLLRWKGRAPERTNALTVTFR